MIGVGRKRRRHDGDKLAVNLRDGSERGWLTPEDISKHRHTCTHTHTHTQTHSYKHTQIEREHYDR